MDTANQDSSASLKIANEFYVPGQDPNQVTDLYTSRSTSYDKILCPGRYKGPFLAAEEAAKYLLRQNRSRMRILDMAAGTGQVGIELRKLGFTKIDAVEPSEGMLKVLKETGAYSSIYKEFIGLGHNTSVPKGTYDAVVMAGGMGEGHVPVQGMEDMIRACKAGGLIVNVMRHEFLHEVQDYRNRLEHHMDLLQRKGCWRREARKVVPNYFCDKEGIMFTHRVL